MLTHHALALFKRHTGLNFGRRVKRVGQSYYRLAWALMLASPALAHAQTSARPDQDPTFAGTATSLPLLAPQAAPLPAPATQTTLTADSNTRPINFQADRVDYDNDNEIVTASGNAYLQRDDQSVRADNVTWNRKTGAIIASGHVRLVDENGNVVTTDEVHLTDSFASGIMNNVMIVLREGGRLAAQSGSRDEHGHVYLNRTAYTSCDVINAQACPIRPSWRITAHRIIYKPERHALRMYGARLVLFGLIDIPLPHLLVATNGKPIPGLLIPNVLTQPENGLGFSVPIYTSLSPNRDLTVTPYIFTGAPPMLEAQYRALSDRGSFQITGYATRSEVIPALSTTGIGSEAFRGYIDTNGSYQLSPNWDVNFSGRLATDRTFLQRYNISGDDVLRSTVDVEHIDANSYLSIAGWAFDTQRIDERQGQVPIALPEIDYRRLIADPLTNGTITLEANSVAISRSAGQDTQRAFTSAQWDLTRFTPMGQIITFTALARGDLYHASNVAETDPYYQGAAGWATRGMVLGAIDVQWPLAGSLLGGTQILTPHIQIVAAPQVPNLAIPDEDSLSVELADTNIFALNRFSGYDRIEDGTRVTYGADWQYDRPRWHMDGTLAQSLHLDNNTQLPPGTGLYGNWSYTVGRFDIRYLDLVKLTERFNINQNSFSLPYNEVDATIGSDQDYFEIGYGHVNNGPAMMLYGLQNTDELRGAVRAAFARYWSIFGSGIFDLAQDPLATGGTAQPFQPLRTRLGVSYQSDCFEVDVTWRRDYVTVGDAIRGSSFLFHFALRNIGVH